MRSKTSGPKANTTRGTVSGSCALASMITAKLLHIALSPLRNHDVYRFPSPSLIIPERNGLVPLSRAARVPLATVINLSKRPTNSPDGTSVRGNFIPGVTEAFHGILGIQDVTMVKLIVY